MNNPFQYGGIVAEDAFCDRQKELGDLLAAMRNGEKLFMYSERRMGKTSLVRRAMDRLPSGAYLSAYIDLWPTDGESSFAAAAAKSIAESMASTADKLLETAKSLFGRLVPALTTDDEGKPQITFGASRYGRPGPELDEVIEAPARIAARRNRKVVIVFDEFQRVLEYENDLVERKIRSAIQKHRRVAYIFLGSRKHLIQKMVLDQSRPLYRAGGHYSLGPISVEAWAPFIQKRFAASGRKITRDRIDDICELTGGHPFYTQHLCHSLWEICRPGRPISDELIQQALRILLDREAYAYTSLWESLTLNHRRLLKGLAIEPESAEVFGSDFIFRYGLRTPSNAQRAVDSLLQRDIIDRQNGSFVIMDRFFRLWIRKSQDLK